MRKTGKDEIAMEESVEAPAAKIIKLASYKEIPEPTYPLGETGKKVYDEWCKTLLDQGRLTKISLEAVEMLALAKQAIATAIKKKKTPSTHLMNTLRTATIRVERLDVNKTMGEVDGHDNPYAKFGFAKRERVKRFGR